MKQTIQSPPKRFGTSTSSYITVATNESTDAPMFDQMNRDESQTISNLIATNQQELLQTNANGAQCTKLLLCADENMHDHRTHMHENTYR